MAFTPASLIADAALGIGLLNAFGARVDVVGIYDGDGAFFGQVFSAARPLEAFVRETSRVMEHPVETGVNVADHHIILPVEIEIPLLLSAQDYASVFPQIRQAFINATLFSVKTRVGVYRDMIISEMPHDEKSEMFDAVVISLRLRQIQYFAQGANQVEDNFEPIDPVNSNTISSGLQSGAAISAQLLSAVGSVASYASLVGRL